MALPMIGYYEQPSAATSWPGWGCLSSRLPRKSSPQAGSHVPSRPPVRVVGSCRSATDGTTGRESKRRDGFKNDPPSPPPPRLGGEGRGEEGAEARRVPKPAVSDAWDGVC